MIFTSTILAGASGSINGLTFSRNRGGQYIRTRAVPTNPNTAQQAALRTIFGNLASAWQTLTATQREDWTTYAINVPVTNKLGNPLTLTGQQMYVRCNTPRLQAGFSRVDDGPKTFALDSLQTVSAAAVAATGKIGVVFDDTDEWLDEDDAGLLVYASRLVGPAINFFKGPYRLAGKIDGDSVTPPTSPDLSLDSPFALTAGLFQFYRFLSVRADGRISADQFHGPVIVS
jgi:hypothetical protein